MKIILYYEKTNKIRQVKIYKNEKIYKIIFYGFNQKKEEEITIEKNNKIVKNFDINGLLI